MKKIKTDVLYAFAVNSMLDCGLSRKDAETVADVLVGTDTFGVLTHGTKNLLGYATKLRAGGLNPKAVPEVAAEGPAWALMNGNQAMGMVSGSRAMELAVEKAKQCGIAYVGVKNSCHFGAAGYYANIAAKNGMIGLVMSNADPIMAVPGGCGVSIGSNPFSYAAPMGNGESVFLDIALSNVAALKVIMAKEKGQTLPAGCLVDTEGRPTTDPQTFPQASSLAPMAAHKGYGLAVMVEIFAAVLTGAGVLSQVKSWNLDPAAPNNAGHAFIAVDVGKMMPMQDFEARMAALAQELRSARKAQGTERIYLPGEMEWEKRRKAERDGFIEVPDNMADALNKLSQQNGIPLEWLE